MTAPNGFGPGGFQQPGGPPRAPNGYVQLAGGYDAATQQGQQQVQTQQPAPVQTPLGQPVQVPMLPPQLAFEQQSPLAQQFLPGQQPPQQQVGQPVQQLGLPFPQQQQQQPAPQGIDLNARVVGQNIPQELQGRTVGEIISIANGLRQVHMQSLQNGGQTQQAPPATPQQQAPAQQQSTQQASTFDWRKPEESIGRVVEERVGRVLQDQLAPMLQPIAAQGAMAGVTAARNQVAAEIGPSYQQLEPLVLQRLQGIDPRALTSPETWRIAARVAIGDLALAPRPQQQQQVQQQYQPQYPQPGLYPAQQVQPGQSPLPNLNGFFTEQPNQGGPGPTAPQLTQQQLAAAAAMNMTAADYQAWSGGVPAQPFGARR